jgi:DNA polymerase III subunit delta'
LPPLAQMQLITLLADGSVRRTFELIGGDAIDLHGKIVGLLSRLPQVDYEAVHKLAETAGAHGADQDFQSFFSLLSDLLARALRARVTEIPLPEGEAEVARCLIPEGSSPARLATWARLWETIVREKAEVQAINLDRKAFIVDTFRRFEAAAGAAD